MLFQGVDMAKQIKENPVNVTWRRSISELEKKNYKEIYEQEIELIETTLEVCTSTLALIKTKF